MAAVPPPPSGWASPALLRSCPYLLTCTVEIVRLQQRSALEAGVSLAGARTSMEADLAAALQLRLPEPRPSLCDLLAAGVALQALSEQQPQPTCRPLEVFLLPFSPAIASLPPPALLALLQACQLIALPEPAASTLAACLAQRYASLTPEQFQAEVGAPSPLWGARVLAWWELNFGSLVPPEIPGAAGHQHNCFCANLVLFSKHLAVNRPEVAFGLPAAGGPPSDFWARGLDCGSTPPPPCAALLASLFGHHAWVQGKWPAATAALKSSFAAGAEGSRALVALLRAQGAQRPLLAFLCCHLLWLHSETMGSAAAAPALAALAEALLAHPESACVAQSVGATVGGIVLNYPTAPGMGAALQAVLPALASALHCLALPHTSTRQVAYGLSIALDQCPPPLIASALATGIVPRLVQLLHWHHSTGAQFHACWALASCSGALAEGTAAVVDAGALPPLVRLLDSPELDVQERAVMALWATAARGLPARLAVLQAGVLPPLLRALAPSATTCTVHWAAKLCRELLHSKVVGGEVLPSLQQVLPLLPRLAALLSSESTGVQVDALWALSYACVGGEDRVQAVLQLGCLGRVGQLLGLAGESVAVPALLLLQNVLAGGELAVQGVLSAGALQALRPLLRAEQPERLRAEACRALRRVCGGSVGQVREVLQGGCLPGLLELAASGGQQEEACWALAGACGSGCRGVLQELGGVGRVREVFGRCQGITHRPEVLAAVGGALEALQVEVAQGEGR